MNAGAQAQRLRPNRAPEKLPSWVLRLSFVGIPLAIVLFVVGSFGLAVLMDEPDRKGSYSQTAFADLWRSLTEAFPFVTPLCFNGGLVTTLMLGSKVLEHRRAVAAEAAALKASGKKKN